MMSPIVLCVLAALSVGSVTAQWPAMRQPSPPKPACDALINTMLDDHFITCGFNTTFPNFLVGQSTVIENYAWGINYTKALCSNTACYASFAKYKSQVNKLCGSSYIGYTYVTDFNEQGTLVRPYELVQRTTPDKDEFGMCVNDGGLCLPRVVATLYNLARYYYVPAGVYRDTNSTRGLCGICGLRIRDAIMKGGWYNSKYFAFSHWMPQEYVGVMDNVCSGQLPTTVPKTFKAGTLEYNWTGTNVGLGPTAPRITPTLPPNAAPTAPAFVSPTPYPSG